MLGAVVLPCWDAHLKFFGGVPGAEVLCVALVHGAVGAGINVVINNSISRVEKQVSPDSMKTILIPIRAPDLAAMEMPDIQF